MKAVRSGVCFAMLFLSLLGCRGEFHQFDQVKVSLALQRDDLEVLRIDGVEEMPNPPVDGEAVSFTFVPDDGSATVEGAVSDSRILRSEFDATGQPDPRTVIGDVGLFDIRVPARAGRLVLKSEAGEVLGEVDIDPNGLESRTMALHNAADVLGGPVKIVDHGDSARKADILFLPEGYTEAEMGDFHAHVDAIVAQLSSHSGYKEHWDGFNIWRQDVRSRTSGTGRGGREIDTAFETASGVSGLERCVFFADADGAQAALRLADQAGADATVVLVNSTGHGGCAGEGVVVSARPRWVADVVGHELAHDLFGLADEYESPSANGFCSVGPNVAASRDALPWIDLLTPGGLPSSPSAPLGTVGAFEGAGYCATGRYRPTHNCMMRTLGSGMCPVCKREVARTMAALAPVSAGSDHSVSVTNASGADLWVRCDGVVSSTCSDWTFLRPSQAATIHAPGRRLVLHNVDVPAPVLFDFRRITAVSGSVTVYANATNPFAPGTSSNNTAGTQPGGSTGGGTPSATLTAPTDLVPASGTYTNSQAVALYWFPVAGATKYVVSVEIEDRSGWTAHDELETDRTTATTYLGADDARYRWRVMACSSAGCISSRHELFEYRAPDAVDEPTPTNNANPTAAPALPQTLSPANEAAVPAGLVSLTWTADPAATSWNVDVRVADGVGGWLAHSQQFALAQPQFTANLAARGTWYAWAVQACNDLGCSTWSAYSLAATNP